MLSYFTLMTRDHNLRRKKLCMYLRTFTFYLFVLLSFTSCAKKYYYLQGYQAAEEIQKNDSIIVKSAFAGDALDFIVFELTIENKTADSIKISYTDINLILQENELFQDAKLLNALSKKDIIYDLEAAAARVSRDKKTRTTLSIVEIGLNLIGIAATGTANSAEAIIYAAESAGYILEERRAYNLLQGSLEEQIKYVEEWVLDKDFVAPDENKSWDILFERILVDSDGSLEVFCADYDFYFDYQFVVKEERY